MKWPDLDTLYRQIHVGIVDERHMVEADKRAEAEAAGTKKPPAKDRGGQPPEEHREAA